jgi:hypothetical protein
MTRLIVFTIFFAIVKYKMWNEWDNILHYVLRLKEGNNMTKITSFDNSEARKNMVFCNVLHRTFMLFQFSMGPFPESVCLITGLISIGWNRINHEKI